jgi:hypothetical protein
MHAAAARTLVGIPCLSHETCHETDDDDESCVLRSTATGSAVQIFMKAVISTHSAKN